MAIAILCIAPAAFAETYIVPDADCGAVTLHTTSTNDTDFPNLGDPIGTDRVADAYLYVPKQRTAVKPSAAAARSLDFKANVPASGMTMMAVDLKPEVIGNETRTEHAKAYVRCGAYALGDDWQLNTVLGVEIFPQWNGHVPSKAGEPMRFIAVDKTTKPQKLILDAPMELYRAGTGLVATSARDSSGGFNFPSGGPGRYMATITYRRPDPQQPDFWLVDTATLTFEIK